MSTSTRMVRRRHFVTGVRAELWELRGCWQVRFATSTVSERTWKWYSKDAAETCFTACELEGAWFKQMRAEERAIRDWVYFRDHGRCVYCSLTLAKREMSADHLIPIKLGGAFTPENLVCACTTCNNERGATPLLVWLDANNARLLRGVRRGVLALYEQALAAHPIID